MPNESIDVLKFTDEEVREILKRAVETAPPSPALQEDRRPHE